MIRFEAVYDLKGRNLNKIYSWGTPKFHNFNKDTNVLFNFISNIKKHNVKEKDVIYTSLCELPRFKLKEFFKQYKLKKTSRSSHSNCFIINKKQFSKLKESSTYGKFYIRGGKELIDKKVELNPINIDLIENHYKFSLKEGVMLKLYRQSKIESLFFNLIERYDDILSGKCKILWDEDLMVNLNKEGVELDDEYLTSLRDMLFSKDKENISLGLEMLCNLQINDITLLHISFLFHELNFLHNCKIKQYSNNPNLKSILNLLDTKGIYWEKDWKDFGTVLRNKFKGKEEANIIKDFLIKNINREFKLSNQDADALVDIVFVTDKK